MILLNGTKKSVRIARIGRNSVLVVDEDKAGYGLIGQKITGKVDDKGTITFTEGGPMSAYWHFTPEPQCIQ